MDLVEIQQLKAFFITAQTLKFSETASKMRLTPSAVSIQIKKLEEEFGTSLFARHKDRLALTEKGQIFLREISPLFGILESAKMALLQTQKSLKTPVVICSVYDIEQYYIDKLILFAKKHPEIRLTILCRSNWDCISMVGSGQADFGLGRFGSIPKNVGSDPLIEVDPCVIMPRSHSLAASADLSLEDIARNSLVVLPKGTRFRFAIEAQFKKKHLEMKVAIEPGRCHDIKTCVSEGFGIGIVHSICLTKSEYKRFHIFNARSILGSGLIKLLYRKRERFSEDIKKDLLRFILN